MFESETRRIAAALAVLWLAGVAAPGGPARAAEPEAAAAQPRTEAPTAARLSELFEAGEAGIREAMALADEIQSATGEQRAILAEKRRAVWTATGQRLGELLQELIQLRQAGVELGASRERAAGVLDRLADWNEEQEAFLRGEVERLRAASDSASPEALPRIEEELREAHDAYDQLLVSWANQAQAREAIGLDASAQYARVDALLTARADERATQVRVTRRRIDDYTRKAAGADAEEKKRLDAEIAAQESRLEQQVQSLRRIADLMDARGLATAAHRGLLIEATGEITTDILSQEVALGLLERWGTDTRQWLLENAPRLVFKAILAAALLFAAHLAGRLLQRVVRRALASSRTPVSQLFQSFVLKMAYRAALGLGALVVLSQLGVQIGPVLAGLGVASFIIGFALQDTLSNFAAGMLILAYRPFDVGDNITAGGVSGRVEAMTLVTTTILTFDNQRLIVPNTKIWGDVITNITAERVRRVDLSFGIGYSDDIDHAQKVLEDIVLNHGKVLKEPAPIIKLHELGDSSVNFIVRPWAQTLDYWDVYWDITREVKRRFDAEGISIPFPQRDVHLIQPNGHAGDGSEGSSSARS